MWHITFSRDLALLHLWFFSLLSCELLRDFGPDSPILLTNFQGDANILFKTNPEKSPQTPALSFKGGQPKKITSLVLKSSEKMGSSKMASLWPPPEPHSGLLGLFTDLYTAW